jgi:uncharacterized protein
VDVNDLPLLELFTKLREVGLPLGIDEYHSVLQAMQAGFGMTDQAALKRLCQTLWVKSAEEKRLFEYHFEQLMGTQAAMTTSNTQSQQRNISQIAGNALLAILAIAIVLGVGLIPKQTTQTPNSTSTPRSEQQAAPPIPDVNLNALPTNPETTSQLNTDSNQPNWIFWGLLLVIGSSAGYALFRWGSRQNAKQRVDPSISVPKSPLSVAGSPLPLEVTQTIEDEIQVAQAVLQATSRHKEIPASRFILSTEYFPVTERQMKQIWRYLRRPVREGAATEFDMEATVNQIGRQGLLLQPILVPPRVNRAELLLLIDQDGSMLPFHDLSHRLTQTALRGGHLGRSGIYYFHNCPIDYLYHDPNHQEAELVSDIVTHICSDHTAVLIFSDAGAARGGHSKERYELTKQFLAKLKQRVRYIAWLNPMPRSRWNKTTAGEIARLVPMFELSRRGLQDAIGVLRGRPTNFQGQRK